MTAPRPSKERVAVVVVHGVADQQPMASVREIASLLANIDDASTRGEAYEAFREEPIRVRRPLRPSAKSSTRPFYAASAATTSDPIDHVLTESMLANYDGEGPGATYETIRLRSLRRTAGKALPVDLYEMYWADLSRVGTGAWRVVGEFYQVLLHVGSLGKHAATAATAPGGGGNRPPGIAGGLFRRSTAWAAVLLGGPIAVFNAFFIVPALLVLASLLEDTTQLWLGIAIAAIAAGALLIATLVRSSQRPRPAILAIAFALLGTLGAVLYFFKPSPRSLSIEVVLVAAAAVTLLLHAYKARRPESWIYSIVGAVLTTGFSLYFVWTAASGDVLLSPGLRIAEVLFVILRLFWIAFVAMFWASLVLGSVYAVSAGRARRAAIKRAVWTTRLALVLPAFGFLLVTVALWAGLQWVVRDKLLKTTFTPSSFMLRAEPSMAGVHDANEFVSALLAASLAPEFAAAAALSAIAVVLALFAFAPVVFREVAPSSTNRSSAQYGHWLNSAFKILSFSGFLMILAFVVWPALSAAAFLTGWDPLARFEAAKFSGRLVGWLGAAIGASAVGLVALRGRLDALSGGFRAPVDVLLDVDGYLREHPRTATPRARIFARYNSLLRFLARQRPAYTRIVVIAHSQGTVITADLLRYLRWRHCMPIASGVQVSLFTMGSPLRQLYAQRFPDLYHWVVAPATHGTASPSPGERIDCAARPDPQELGLARWVNAYRSGDYIGRWLWRADDCDINFTSPDAAPFPWSSINQPPGGQSTDTPTVDATASRREFCIGSGAHTHYWNQTAPQVAVELDLLIRTWQRTPFAEQAR